MELEEILAGIQCSGTILALEMNLKLRIMIDHGIITSLARQ